MPSEHFYILIKRCVSRGFELTYPVRCARTTPRAKAAHIAKNEPICQTACRTQLPNSGIKMEPRGYNMTMTMLMRIPWADSSVGISRTHAGNEEPELEPESLPEVELLPGDVVVVPLPLPPLLAATNGFVSSARVALVRSNVNWLCESCMLMVAVRLLLLSELPDFHAAMKGAPELDKLIDPPSHDWQLAHRTFATMVLSATPLPASSCRLVVVWCCGSVWPVPLRAETVTLPAPSVYMTKILAPDICDPVPRATQVYDVGAFS